MVKVQVNIAGCAPALCSRLVCSGVLLGRVFFLLGFSCAGGVRPAAHLSLNQLASEAGYTISASLASAATDRAQLDTNSAFYVKNSGAQHAFTYTANNKYYINSITINGSSVTIAETAPGSFSTVSGAQYKCYRNNNQVIVILTNLTQNSTIVGNATSLFNLSSNNSTLVIQDNCITPDTYFDTTAEIVATFSQNQNIQFTIDGVTVRLFGNNSSGRVMIPSGALDYAHNIYENNVVIELTNLPHGQHNVTIGHYVGTTASITADYSGGSGTIEMYKNESGVQLVIMRPATSQYVHSITIDGAEIFPTYYRAEIFGAGGALQVRYTAKDTSNVFVIELEDVYDSIDINFNLSTVKPVYQVPPTSGGVGIVGTVATASTGGEVRMVGNDIANGADTDTVTFIAVAYTGYEFVGWVNANDETETFGTALSINLTKEQVNGKIIKAVFREIESDEATNDDVDNNYDDLV